MKACLPLLLALAVVISACHEPFSNDDLLFLKAAPRGLRIDVPSHGAQQALRAAQSDPNTPARFYQDTRQAAEDVNNGVLALLDLIDAVVVYEPTVREEDQRIWGPFPIDDSTELALIVNRTRTATTVTFTSTSAPASADAFFEYLVLARPIGGSDEDFVGLYGGRSLPQTSNRQGTGLMFVDLDGIRRFDPNADGTGQLFVGYDTRDGRTVIELAADAMVMGRFEADVAWSYRLEATGSGRFNYWLRENIVETTPQPELLAIASRWMPDNRGRADVVVTEGDVPFFYFASECWDPGFSRVFLLSNVPDPDFSAVGRVENCGEGLQTSQFAEDD